MNHYKFSQKIFVIGLILLFLMGCGALATPTATPAPPTSTPTPIPVPATQTPIPPTPTPTALLGPKAGRWEGASLVSFEVGTDGKIHNFQFTLTTPSGSCTITADEIPVEADRTFAHIFGEPLDEEGNTIRGKFESNDTVTGSYSRSIFCVDPSGSAILGTFGDEGTWSAEWKEE